VETLLGRLDRKIFRTLRGSRWLQHEYLSLNRRVSRVWGRDRRYAVAVPGCGSMRLNKVDLVNLYLYYFGIWEPGLTQVVSRALRPGDVFVDVGANLGYYTLLGSRLVGEAGEVIAIEASPSVFAILEEHVRLNARNNVKLFNVAAADAPGHLDIYAGPRDNVGTTSTLLGPKHRYEARVQALPLDELLRASDLQRVRCVKIDVEGGEFQVVQGMRASIAKLPADCSVLLEVSVRALHEQGHDVADLLQPFSEQGFQAFQVENQYEEAFYADFRAPRIAACRLDDLRKQDVADLLLTRREPTACVPS
jgi:FkbM family methyltransferase